MSKVGEVGPAGATYTGVIEDAPMGPSDRAAHAAGREDGRREAADEIERVSALWIAETRENERLRGELESVRSVYDFAALETKNEQLRANLKSRDDFLVAIGQWSAYTDSLPRRHEQNASGETK